jgi:hypothetical protein
MPRMHRMRGILRFSGDPDGATACLWFSTKLDLSTVGRPSHTRERTHT